MRLIEFLLVASLLLINESIFSQAENGFSIEIDFLRKTQEDRGYDIFNGFRKFSWLNALNIGYQKNENLNFKLGLRRIIWENTKAQNYLFADFQARGIEINSGIDFKVFELKRWKLELGPELFWEQTKFLGTDNHGHGRFEINYQRNYMGIAANLVPSFKISKNIFLVFRSRYRVGRITYPSTDKLVERSEGWLEDQLTIFHMLGVKYKIPNRGSKK